MCVGRIRPALVLGGGVLAMLAIVLSGLSWPLTLLASALIVLALVQQLRSSRRRLARLVFHPDRTLGIDGWRGPPRSEFVSTLLVVLRCDGAATPRCTLFRDQVDPETWQRLRAWLRHP